MMIDNFILVYYLQKTEINTPDWFPRKANLVEIAKEKYWRKMLHMMYRQLDIFYPNAKIHIVTNEHNLPKNDRVIFHYFSDLNGLMSKFKIFNLIEEPAMYLDLDVLLTRQFEDKHLETEFPFNVFRKYKGNIPAIQGIPGLQDVVRAYNTGIVWVKEPNEKMEKQLLEYQQQYFSNQEQLNKLRVLSGNDEHALAVYIIRNNYLMKTFEELSKPRDEIKCFSKLKDYQSIHYMGIHKKMMGLESFILHGKVL